MQNACRAKDMKVPDEIIDVIFVATSVITAYKKKVALKQSNARLIVDMGKLRKDLDEARRIVQMEEAREKTLMGQVTNLKIKVQNK